MAQAYASLGSTVTLVELGERLIAGEEEFASEQVLDALRDAGVTVRPRSQARAPRAEWPTGPSSSTSTASGRSRPTSCSSPPAAGR